MNRLGKILRAFFWLPIIAAGATGFTLVTPELHKYRFVGMGVLALFMLLGLVQTFADRARQRARIKAREK